MSENKKVTLDDLKETPVEDTAAVAETPAEETVAEETVVTGKKEVSAGDILPYSEEKPSETAMNAMMGELEAATERVKDDIDLLKDEFNDKVESGEIVINEEDGSISVGETPSDDIANDADILDEGNTPAVANKGSEPKKKIVVKSEDKKSTDEDEVEDTLADINDKSDKPLSIDEVNDDEFFADLEKEFGEDETSEEEDEDKELTEEEQTAQVERLKDAINEKVTPIKKVVDLSKFTIRKKPIAISKLVNMENENAKIADWIYWSAKRPFSMREFKGAEIDQLNVNNDQSRNRLNKLKEVYRLFYDHIVDANKPKDFETWLKSTSFFEINHIWFGAYKASFAGANSIPYSCPKCHEMFIQDADFDSMVKYADDDVKAEVKKIMEMDTTSPMEEVEYEVELKQVSDEYVFALKEPTLWGVIFETAALSDEFTSKYQEVLGLMAYIDDIYYINGEDEELIPINTNPDPNNTVKTAMRKITAYYKILSTLNSDQYYNLTNYIQNINERDDKVTFQLPECTCPKCNTKIPAEGRTPEQLLFTRHQLRAIANISTR